MSWLWGGNSNDPLGKGGEGESRNDFEHVERKAAVAHCCFFSQERSSLFISRSCRIYN